MATVAFRYGMGACLALIGLLSVILNCFLFFICVKRKRLRKPSQYFLISLAVVDILAVAGWLSLTAVSLFNDGWIFPSEICKVQEYIMSLWLFLNSHSFVLLAFDRCLLFVRPSKHSEIFINTVVLIMLLALWLFDGILAAFPYFGWGTVSYFSNQFQCAMDHEKNIRETNFVTALCFGIPITLCMGMYLFIFIMIRKIKKREDDNGALIVERNRKAIGDSYSQRLRNQQYRFQNAGTRAIKPNIGKKFTYTEDGYISNDSSDDENTKETVQKGTQKQNVQQKKVYHMAKNDTLLTKTYIIMTCLTFLLWLPYLVVTYIFLKDRFANISDELVFVVIFLCQCTTLVKPVVYVTYNSHFRKHVIKLFRRKINKQTDGESNSQTDGQGYDNLAMQQ
ncbi:5-hydroxytryptamine receptor 1F-like [Saccostrea echinata]|uniref:5-hydroxytryptamine receptor 1F-like n=1 Tax=Saccostrea echinata TaxID=191078 RepID=UPI002A83FC9B|nr:5-hydroxytryptamine receptor 1F-like [Saccostrea echinata]